MTAKRALDRLVSFLEEQPPVPVAKPLGAEDPELAPLLALARSRDPRLHALMHVLVERRTSFCVYDVEMYPEYFTRGKRGEKWNDGGRVIGPDDLCIARNGGGDPYVWNATRGDVRFLVHDEGWESTDEWEDVDSFFEELLRNVVEAADADQVEEAADWYLKRLCFAIEVAGEDGLHEEVKEKLIEKGLLDGG